MPMYENKELQMNLGTSYRQAMMASVLDCSIIDIYKIKIIQAYYIQYNRTKCIVVHGNLSSMFVKADPIPLLVMIKSFTPPNDVLVSPRLTACLPCYAHHDPPLRQLL